MTHPLESYRWPTQTLDFLLSCPCMVLCHSPMEARRLRHALYRRKRRLGFSMIVKLQNNKLTLERPKVAELEVVEETSV